MAEAPGPLTEDQFQRQVIDLAHAYHWLVAHFRAARTDRGWRTPVEADAEGFPDLVLVRGKRLIFAELKSQKGRVSAAQQGWLDSLAVVCAGVALELDELRSNAPPNSLPVEPPSVEVYVWRPSMFDEVHELLKLPAA